METITTDFRRFVSAHGPTLTRYAYLLCGDRVAAEDLTQSALLKAYRSWAKISAVDDPVGYVRRIVTREFLSMRRKRSATEVPLADVHRAGPEGTAPDHADSVVEADEVWRALTRLTSRQRAVLVMRYYLDLPYEEIGRLLNCSSGTARTHASSGLAALRRAETPRREVALDDR